MITTSNSIVSVTKLHNKTHLKFSNHLVSIDNLKVGVVGHPSIGSSRFVFISKEPTMTMYDGMQFESPKDCKDYFKNVIKNKTIRNGTVKNKVVYNAMVEVDINTLVETDVKYNVKRIAPCDVKLGDLICFHGCVGMVVKIRKRNDEENGICYGMSTSYVTGNLEMFKWFASGGQYNLADTQRNKSDFFFKATLCN